MARTALIVGAGSGISASFARLLAKVGYRVALASRDPAKLTRLAAETKAMTHACDAADPASVDQLFAHFDQQFPKLDVCLFNASARPGLSGHPVAHFVIYASVRNAEKGRVEGA